MKLNHKSLSLFIKRAKIISSIKKKREPLFELKRLVDAYNQSPPYPSVLLFGDSVTERISRTDFDKRTLGQIIADSLKEKFQVLTISYSAFNLKIFYFLLLALSNVKNRPKILILPINMRSFSPQWDFEPSWQFLREIEIVKEFISTSRIDDALELDEDFSEIAYNNFDSKYVDYPLSSLDKIGQFRLIINSSPATEEQKRYRLSQIFIFHYTNPLSPNHPKVQYLEKILELADKMNISVFIYITPINIQSAVKYVGNKFTQSFNLNLKVIKNAIRRNQKSTIKFKDYSKILTADNFFHENTLVEHLNQEGRNKIASLITSEVLKIEHQ